MGIQIMGLMIMFLLVIFYWYNKDKLCKRNHFYQYFLILNYLFFFFDVLGEVFFPNDVSVLHYLFLIAIDLGFTFYVLHHYIEEKYSYQSSLLEKKRKNLVVLYGGVFGLEGIFFLCCSKITFFGLSFGMFLFMVNIFFFLFVLIFLGNKLKARDTFHFCVLFLFHALGAILEVYFPRIGFSSISCVLGMLYLYLTLENIGIEELEVLRVENAYQKEQAIDKIAFLKNISHEIRTPINTIDGFSQMIMDNDDITSIKKDVLDMRIASRDLIDVINGMIDLSIIESGELKIIPEDYNVYDMFDSVIDIVHAKLRERSVELEVAIEKDIPEVLWGDSERISQVILNLMKNAIKRTEKGKIILAVRRIKSDTLCRLKIEIKDTGEVISKEELERIFSSSFSSFEGNLNLAVTRYLIDKMNGSLEVDNTYQEGNCFVITLDQKIIREHQDKSKRKEKVLKPFLAQDKRILIVDDNKLNLKVASRLLMPYHPVIVEANSGQECLDILDTDHDFDLILMDDLMPGLSGTDTMHLIKKIGRVDGYYIPVVALTANAVSGQREKYLEMGFDDYLSKPIDRYELDLILKKYLKGNLSK